MVPVTVYNNKTILEGPFHMIQPTSIRRVLFALLALAATSSSISQVLAEQDAKKEYPRPYELLDIMNKFQRFTDKLYFAGQAKNAELTEWYLWKLEQAALEVTNGHTKPWYPPHVDEAEMIETMLFPAIRTIEENLKKRDWAAFNNDYEGLVISCNGCHQATAHGYVKIITPAEPTYRNQDFTVDPE